MDYYGNIDLVAVLVAALAAFVLGAIWYNPKVFGTAWMKDLKLTGEDLKGASMAKIFGFSFVLYLLASASLDAFLRPSNYLTGAISGFILGLGFASTFIGINYLFERKPFRLWLINAGYAIISLTLMGLIQGLF